MALSSAADSRSYSIGTKILVGAIRRKKGRLELLQQLVGTPDAAKNRLRRAVTARSARIVMKRCEASFPKGMLAIGFQKLGTPKSPFTDLKNILAALLLDLLAV